MVAIDTTPKVEPETQTQALHQWIKRTQEVLAHRSLQGRKFHRLYDLMRTKRLVAVALDNVLSNQGARTAGVDGVTRADLTTLQARKQLVDEIHQELKTKTYQPQPVRRVYIPKTKGKRALGIPPIRDRVVQEMLRLILEPIYEARFYAHSYGFRPFRSTHHAAVRLKDLIGRRGYTYAIEGDIRQCFDRIHHARLLKILRQTIQDERIIRLVRAMLKAGVMEDGAWHITEEGTPQGGIVSPLLANIYLNELDWFIAAKWDTLSRSERERRHRQGVALPCYITRYADDFVILVRGTREQAEQLKAEIAAFLSGELHLELSEEKTWITPVEQGFDFLGFHIRKYRRATLITPSRQAMIKFRAGVKQRIWEGFGCDDAAGIVHLNRYLIGWGMYYRRVSSARAFKQADYYVWQQVWRSTHRLRNPSLTFAQHFRAHYLPYRCDIRLRNRKRRGGHYGTWADKAHSTAHLVTKLRFIPIRYVQLHSQLNPYVPTERTVLKKRTGALETSPDPPPTSRTNPDYGIEWETLRRAVLEKAGHRCQQCGQVIRERNAHVHHRRKRRWCRSRKQANLLENLVALCPRCHRRADGQNNG